MMDSEIEIYYDGEDTEDVYLFSITGYFEAVGNEYPSYEYQIIEAPGDVYPGGEIEGWIGALVSQNFSPSKVTIEIAWQGAVSRWALSGPVPTHPNPL